MLTTFDELRTALDADARVVGLVLGGSRGKGCETEESDWDVYVIAVDDAAAEAVAAELGELPAHLELCQCVGVDSFARHAGVGDPQEWNRYAFAHVTPVIDRLGGAVGELCRAKELVPPDVAHARAGGLLDAYANARYRAAKSHRAGRADAARLDAAESLPHLLALAFTAEGRARPYNAYLTWELERHPLVGRWLPTQDWPATLLGVAAGDEELAAAVFRRVEAEARARDLGDVLDAWGADSLRVMRGGSRVAAG